MRKLNKGSKKVFLELVKGLNYDNLHRKIENSKSFMAVAVDYLVEIPKIGNIFAIAHNYIQNGDVMADPDMEFLVSSVDGEVYPMTYQNGGYYSKGAEIREGQIFQNAKVQADIASFANTWMKNIKHQQL